jgi:hypothetical protein
MEIFEEDEPAYRVYSLGYEQLLDEAYKIEDDSTFIEFCRLNGMFNQKALKSIYYIVMSEHDPFSFDPTGGLTWKQHAAFGRLSHLYQGAVAWHQLLMYEVQKYTKSDWQQDIPATVAFLRRYEIEEN